MKRIPSLIVIAALLGSTVTANAQTAAGGIAPSPEYWLKYTEKLPIGATVRVRTTDGKRITAVLAIVDETGITVQPKTRVPERPSHIPFDQLAQIELKQQGGSNAGKAAAIGVATGAATFFGILLLAFAAWGD